MSNKLNIETSPYLSDFSKIGWHFDNSYLRLPKIMLSQLSPSSVKMPKLIILNHTLSKNLNLDFSAFDEKSIASIFSGNSIPPGSSFIAQAYAGHQFGHFTMLGDGRALLMGEHITLNNKRFDVQLKGSGKTPYSRNGDGRAALGPVLREYVISEAMNAMDIPTTRSLAVVTTGESVFRETPLPGAILTRIATSHIRVGTFQYMALHGDIKNLKRFVDYTINRHYPEIKGAEKPVIALLKIVIKKQIELITNWMRVGFVHGVMNTDNMAISGETIDYGPCAFMDVYNPETVFSSIDHHGRYAFNNQPSIAHWNLLRFAETLLPLVHDNQNKAIELLSEVINGFGETYKKHWLKMMRKKLGLLNEKKEDEALISNLLSWMQQNNADFTNTFNSLIKEDFTKNELFQGKSFLSWYKQWRERLRQNNKPTEVSLNLMRNTNPFIIPRNHKVEEALSAASGGDLSLVHKLLDVLQKPYNYQPSRNPLEIATYQSPPAPSKQVYKTFCGT